MKRFDATVLTAIDLARSLGVRSGDQHKYTNVWVVAIDGRVVVRSWNNKPTGWFRAFLREPLGSIRVGKKEMPARGVHIRNTRLLNAVSAAITVKYPDKGSQQYVLGFRTPKRKATTLEFVPT